MTMTIKDLKEKIKDMPDNLDVMIEQRDDTSAYNMACEAVIEDVLFGDEDMDRKEWATEKCLVIRD